MPTAKKRVNLCVEDRVYRALRTLSRRRKSSISSVSHGLIERALELEEDLYYSRIADERLDRKVKRVSHVKAWE